MGKERTQRRIVGGAISFLSGAAALGLFSTFQKWLVGAPFSLSGYVAPLLVGGAVGVFIGLRHLRLRETAEALRAGRERYRVLFHSAPDGILVLDRDGCIVEGSEAAARLCGASAEALVGRHITALMTPACREEYLRGFAALASLEPTEGEIEIVRADGAVVPVWRKGVPLTDAAGRFAGVLEYHRDITARKEIEAVLLKEKNFCTSAIKSLPGILYVFDSAGRFIRWNETLERVTGYSAEEIARMNPLEFVVAPDQALATEKIREVFETGQTSCELGLRTKDGTTFTFFHTGVRTEIDGVMCLVGVGIDISERKRAEEERLRLEAQIQHGQKLESLGVLAGGIAHDFNNLLVGIVGHASLAQMELPEGAPGSEALRQIGLAAQRAADLANQMLAYSGKGRFAVGTVDVSALVEEMAHLLKVSISKKANLRFEITPNLPLIEADATQLRQVVMNLITNASDALRGESGEIVLGTGRVRADRAYFADTYLADDLPAGDYLYIEVRDTGCGMDERTRTKMFDPFFTTKFAGRGLGLAAVLGIVRGHRGGLKVSTDPGRGTTFRVLLPCEAAGARHPVVETPAPRGNGEGDWRGAGTILVADDEEVVRTVAKLTLERFGFDVLCAADGPETVECFGARGDEIAAVLLDISMPGLGGEEVLARLRAMRADVPVLLTSGYDEQELARGCTAQVHTGFIQKPYRPQELLDKLRGVLSA